MSDPDRTPPDTLLAVFNECEKTRQACERMEERVIEELKTLRRRVDYQLYLTVFAVLLSIAALTVAFRS